MPTDYYECGRKLREALAHLGTERVEDSALFRSALDALIRMAGTDDPAELVRHSGHLRGAADGLVRYWADRAADLAADPDPEPDDAETVAAREHAHDADLRAAGRGHLVRP